MQRPLDSTTTHIGTSRYNYHRVVFYSLMPGFANRRTPIIQRFHLAHRSSRPYVYQQAFRQNSINGYAEA